MEQLNKICNKLLDVGYILILVNPSSMEVNDRYKIYSSLDKPALSKRESLTLIGRIKKLLTVKKNALR